MGRPPFSSVEDDVAGLGLPVHALDGDLGLGSLLVLAHADYFDQRRWLHLLVHFRNLLCCNGLFII